VTELDYLHAVILIAVAIYVWQREPLRLLLTPLMLVSFVVIYGIGMIIYFLGTDTVPHVRANVTLCLILMWIGLLMGIEISRATVPAITRRAHLMARAWESQPLTDQTYANQLLALVGLLVALFLLGVFLGLGKPGQILSWLSIEGAKDKLKYRMELGGQGGYVYQTLIASLAPFLSFLLLSKAAVGKQLYMRVAATLLCMAIVAGKIGTFQKVPWLIYLLQIAVVYQATRRLEFGFGRILFYMFLVIGGTAAATALALSGAGLGIFEFLLYRFFEVNTEVVYQTFYVYPDHLPHTWGMNIGLFHSIFGTGELSSAHTEVANFFGAEGATFDAFFIADSWVDFGFVGVAIMSVVVGFVVKSVDLYVLVRGKTPLAVALIGSGMYGVFQLQVTSAFTAFLSGGLVFIPLLVLLAEAFMNDLARGQLQWQR
jgi:hypothetical protein